MKIVRIYNNNVIVSLDSDNDEMIVIGKGIGFKKKIGDQVEIEKVEKIFTLKDKRIQGKLEELVKRIPSIYLNICEKIVSMIHSSSGIELNESIYVTLTDHISMSLERERKGIVLENMFEFEIGEVYNEEYALGIKAAEIIKDEMGIEVSKSEISFITMHIVNANLNQNAELTIKISKMILKIIRIIEKYTYKEIDKKSFTYMRFIRHLKFFLKRSIEKRNIREEDYFYKIVVMQFPETFNCVEEISRYVKECTQETVTDTEKGYLIYHIMSIIKEKGNQVMDGGL